MRMRRSGTPLKDFGLYLALALIPFILRLIFVVPFSDDAYITFKVALHLAQGNGMVFNLGEGIYVGTAPLWAILLAGFRFLFVDILAAAQFLGGAAEAILFAAMMRYAVALSYGRMAGLLATVFLAMNPRFLVNSFGGMELPLYLSAWILTCCLLCAKRHMSAMTVAALALWVRTDGIIVYMVAFCWFIWTMRKEVWVQRKSLLITVLPSVVVIVGYAVFGSLMFETVIPTSVQRKALTSPAILSPEWRFWAWSLAKEFVKAIVGRGGYWPHWGAPFTLLAGFAVLGAVQSVRQRDKSLLPLVMMTCAYAVSFASTGSRFVLDFPWYFAPVLPLLCLLAGSGFMNLVSWLARLTTLRQQVHVGLLAVVLASAWIVAAISPVARAVRSTKDPPMGTDERERVYAAAAVWAGEHLHSGDQVAANEIGTIGFFLPDTIGVVDLFGILRHKEQISTDYMRLVAADRPVCIFTREHFDCKKRIASELRGAYLWYKFRSLDIGLRTDRSLELANALPELHKLYEAVDLRREYHGSSGTTP